MTKEELKQEAERFARTEMSHPNEYGMYYCTFLKVAEPREKRIAELKAQIEKMKCCYNCKHSRTDYEHCITDKHEKWEMIEK